MQDFFNIDSALSEDERAVRDSVRRFVDERVLPIIGECYVEGRFPKELIPGMAELGVLGANLPEEYGCAGLNNVAYGLIMQELERGDSGSARFASVQGALVMYPIYAFGSEEQKKTVAAADGRRRGHRLLRPHRARLRLEPGGHDHHGQASRRTALDPQRRQDVDHQRHPGQRGGRLGQDQGDKDEQSIRGFIVPTDTKGFTAQGPEGEALAPRVATRASSCSQDVHLPGRRDPPEDRRTQEPAHVPHPGALRHRLGRASARRWPASRKR